MIRRRTLAALVCAGALAAGCQHDQAELILSKKSPVELRAMQSRQFETGDQEKVYRAVIATFQDLGYSITKVEPNAGTVSANKLALLTMTATVFPRGENRMIVRSNAVVKPTFQLPAGHQVDAPEFYQQRFFEPLSKALFLTALQVEDPPDATERAAVEKAREIEEQIRAKAKAEKEKAEREAAEKEAAEKAKKAAAEREQETAN